MQFNQLCHLLNESSDQSYKVFLSELFLPLKAQYKGSYDLIMRYINNSTDAHEAIRLIEDLVNARVYLNARIEPLHSVLLKFHQIAAQVHAGHSVEDANGINQI